MSTKKILLKSSDGDSYEVDEAVSRQSSTISNAVEDCADEVPLANVSSKILKLVIKYCEKHGSVSEEDHEKWDAQFVSGMDQPTIIDLILASNYLDIPSLLGLTCQRIADMIGACKDPDEIREKFKIKKDLTPEEENKIIQENLWAFQ